MTREFFGTLHTTATQNDSNAGTRIAAQVDADGRVWVRWASKPDSKAFKLKGFHIVHWDSMRKTGI